METIVTSNLIGQNIRLNQWKCFIQPTGLVGSLDNPVFESIICTTLGKICTWTAHIFVPYYSYVFEPMCQARYILWLQPLFKYSVIHHTYLSNNTNTHNLDMGPLNADDKYYRKLIFWLSALVFFYIESWLKYSKTSITRARIELVVFSIHRPARYYFFISLLSYPCCVGYFHKSESPDVRIKFALRVIRTYENGPHDLEWPKFDCMFGLLLMWSGGGVN